MTTSVAEDLLLLLLDDASGATHGSTYVAPGLGGALLVELALEGRVEVVEHGGLLRRQGVRALGAAPDDDLLAGAWSEVARKERSPQHLVGRLGRGLEEPLAQRLVDQGVLERHDATVLGLFHRTRWPARDGAREAAVRRDLASVLVEGAEPDRRTAALVALLLAVGRAHKVVDHEGLRASRVRARARSVARATECEWAAQGVKDAIAAAGSGSFPGG